MRVEGASPMGRQRGRSGFPKAVRMGGTTGRARGDENLPVLTNMSSNTLVFICVVLLSSETCGKSKNKPIFYLHEIYEIFYEVGLFLLE